MNDRLNTINPTTKQLSACICPASKLLLDESDHSRTFVCPTCHRSTLVIESRNMRARIVLARVQSKYSQDIETTAQSVKSIAKQCYEDLLLDRWPRPEIVESFGICSSVHFGALQFAVRAGVTPYDLYRVIWDGQAISQLVQCVRSQPYPPMVYQTVWDDRYVTVLEE